MMDSKPNTDERQLDDFERPAWWDEPRECKHCYVHLGTYLHWSLGYCGRCMTDMPSEMRGRILGGGEA